ncbi:hypothetical protein B0H13DRAFT_881558 [Mycena leptocephala]|nr:hypothetical protein B0H13DRAFT_881558 [Mycena leptocephala]
MLLLRIRLSTLSTTRVLFLLWFESRNMSTCPDEFGNKVLHVKAHMPIGTSESSVARIFRSRNLDEFFCTHCHGRHSNTVSQAKRVQWHTHTLTV